MARQLRPYQTKMIEEARGLLRVHNSILMVAPTGAGKTSLASYMLNSAAERGKRGWFIVPKIELVHQTAETFREMDIPYGIISAGMPVNPYMPVQICSVDTLRNRLGRYQKPDLIVWDESHHAPAGGWKRIKDANPQAKHVGLTATPERLDGKGLNDLFSAMVMGPSMKWLIEQGYLSPYRAFVPPGPDLTGIKTVMGDFHKGQSEAVMDTKTITGCAVEHYLRYARGKRAVVFCVSVKHSEHVAEQFKAAGIVAVHLDGNTPKDVRARSLDAFRRGEIQVLTNCNLFSEGVDVPGIEVIIMLRPTQSISMFMQAAGRGLRAVYAKGHDLSTQQGRLAAIAASPKQSAIIFDHAGNIPRHGLPDDDREWSLEGRKKREAGKRENDEPSLAMRQCPKCYAAHGPAPKCPECGHVYQVIGRTPEQVDAELQEIDLDAVRKRRVIENRKAESLEELVEIGKQRQYKKPLFWAAHYHLSRKGDESTLNELIAYAHKNKLGEPDMWAAKVMSAVMAKRR